MFGSSWMTSVVGYIVIVFTVAQQVLTEGGLPSDAPGWIRFAGGIITGVGLRLAKDSNKSNAPEPKADAEVVTPAGV